VFRSLKRCKPIFFIPLLLYPGIRQFISIISIFLAKRQKFHINSLIILESLASFGVVSVEKIRSTRFYQGLTSRYNIYFNGNEALKQVPKKIKWPDKGRLSELLKVFDTASNDCAMCSADMQRAITESSKVISLKSIKAKPETKAMQFYSKGEEFLNRRNIMTELMMLSSGWGKQRLYTTPFLNRLKLHLV